MAMNPGVGHVGDFGLRTTGLVLGGALVALGAVAPLLMRSRRPVGSVLPASSGGPSIFKWHLPSGLLMTGVE